MANPVDRNALASTLMTLFRGGAAGPRGDPYANQAAGPFANSPRIYGRPLPGAAPAAAAAPVARAPVPARKPKRGGAGAGKPVAATGPNNVPIPNANPRQDPMGTYMIGDQGNMPSSPAPSANPLQDAVDAAPRGGSASPLYNPLQAAVDAAPGGMGYQSPSHNLGLWNTQSPPPAIYGVPGGAATPGDITRTRGFMPTPITNPAQQGPSAMDYWRMLTGSSGRGQTSY